MKLFREDPKFVRCEDTRVIVCPRCFWDVDEIDLEEPSPFYFDLTCPSCHEDIVVDGVPGDFRVYIMGEL